MTRFWDRPCERRVTTVYFYVAENISYAYFSYNCQCTKILTSTSHIKGGWPGQKMATGSNYFKMSKKLLSFLVHGALNKAEHGQKTPRNRRTAPIAKKPDKREALAPTPGTRALRHPTATRSYRDTNNVRGVMLERPTELLVGTQSLPIDRPRSWLPTQNAVSKYVLYNIAPRSCPCMCFWQ